MAHFLTHTLGDMKRCVAACLCALLAPLAPAQEWPQRPVKIVVPFAPASTPDSFARLLAENLRKRLGQPVIAENRPGAGGMIGTDAVAKAPPDGHTIGVSIVGPLVNNKLLYRKMPYDPDRDLVPITLAVTQASLLVVPADRNVRTVPELLAYLRAKAGRASYASIGVGSLSHLTMELVALRSDTEIVHVPYAGSSQAVAALVAGDVDMACLPALSVMPQARAGKLRIIGASTAKRSALLAGIPTLKEQGLGDVDAGAWIGVVAPAGTPAAIVERLRRETVATLREPAVAAALEKQMMEAVGSTPEEFAAHLAAERERWTPVIRRARISLD
jgi:tripartite-type tricarboxylate transporter receptor subunit TctC